MMKNLFLSLFGILISIASYAQDCVGVGVKAGSGFEMNNYDGKGKSTGKLVYKIVNVSAQDGKTAVTIEFESFSAKGKSEMKNTYKMICDGNSILLDASSLVSTEQMKSFENMDMKFTYDNIEYPAKLSVGQKLKDASVKGEGKSGPLAITFKMLIHNRNVAAQEKITTPAGTFDASKITSDMTMETLMGMNMKFEMNTVSYRAPGVLWDVKSESYRKGKLMGYSELTKIY
ncbi:hypothetical protein [Dyadobacter sp. 32]|uniref:TapB family protein n=1 Tax=Dyadobacter sp. 32 TaxID=538966 RepID=UPI0011EC6A69